MSTQIVGRVDVVGAFKFGIIFIALAVWGGRYIEQPLQSLTKILAPLGIPFSVLYISICAGLICIGLMQLNALKNKKFPKAESLTNIGVQLAGLLATVSLVFTLWGLSQGVLLLSEGEVRPDNINQLLGELMTHFGTAFYSSVIGLPTSAVARFVLLLNYPKIKKGALKHETSH